MSRRLVSAVALAVTAVALAACAGSSSGDVGTSAKSLSSSAHPTVNASPSPAGNLTLEHGPRNLATPILLQPIRDVTGPNDDCPGARGATTTDYTGRGCYRLDKPVLTIRRLMDMQAIAVSKPSVGASPSGSVTPGRSLGDTNLVLTLTKADRAALADYTAIGRIRLALTAVVIDHTIYYALRTHPQNDSGRIMLTFDADLAHTFVATITK